MPKLTDDMENFHAGNFSFSGTKMDKLESSLYTLAVIVVDESGSVANFKDDLEKAIKESVKALKYSPRAENLLLRVLAFSNDVREIHGFKLLGNVNIDDYSGCLVSGGMTALYDATVNGIDSIKNYSIQTYAKDIDTNGIIIVITDGDNNIGSLGVGSVASAKSACVTSEAIESILSILVGVNVQNPLLKQFLSDYEKDGKFDQYVELADASAKTLARLGQFVSKSISSQSQNIGSGGASKPVNFNGSLAI